MILGCNERGLGTRATLSPWLKAKAYVPHTYPAGGVTGILPYSMNAFKWYRGSYLSTSRLDT